MADDFIPIFARVFALADKPQGNNPYADQEDPTSHPMLIVCFGLDGHICSGYYLPEADRFFELADDSDDKDWGKADVKVVPKDDPKHKACLDTVTRFAADLPDGGTNMDKVKFPSRYQSRRGLPQKTPSSPPSSPTAP